MLLQRWVQCLFLRWWHRVGALLHKVLAHLHLFAVEGALNGHQLLLHGVLLGELLLLLPQILDHACVLSVTVSLLRELAL